MLIIRAEQLDALAVASRDELAERLRSTLIEAYPDATRRVSRASLERTVDEAITLATSLGCQRLRAFADLTGLLFELGPALGRSRLIAACLADITMDPDARVAAIFEQLTPSDWAEVAATAAEG